MKRPVEVPQIGDNRPRLAARAGAYEMSPLGAEKPKSGSKKIAAILGVTALAAATFAFCGRDPGEPGRSGSGSPITIPVVEPNILDELDAQHRMEEAIERYTQDDGEVDVLEEMDIEYEVENPDG